VDLGGSELRVQVQARSMGSPRDYSAELAFQLRAVGAPSPQREYPFAKPERAFRADLCWPALWLIVEVDGAVHRLKGQFTRDFERDQWIFFSRWRKLRVSPAQVRSGIALQLVERALSVPA
jgi:hypothetical protein